MPGNQRRRISQAKNHILYLLVGNLCLSSTSVNLAHRLPMRSELVSDIVTLIREIVCSGTSSKAMRSHSMHSATRRPGRLACMWTPVLNAWKSVRKIDNARPICSLARVFLGLGL